MKTKRDEAHAGQPDAAFQLRDLALKHLALSSPRRIAIYHNIGSELSPLPLAESLRNQGHIILLPVIIGKAMPLRFHLYKPGDTLVSGWGGILEPLAAAEVMTPDIICVPLLAFDRNLYRLGYGGGYYDRTLESLRKTVPDLRAIGIGYACQEVSHIPHGPYDMQLDQIITPNEVI